MNRKELTPEEIAARAAQRAYDGRDRKKDAGWKEPPMPTQHGVVVVGSDPTDVDIKLEGIEKRLVVLEKKVDNIK